MAVMRRNKHESVAALQARYRRADRAAKARLLDGFCAATGYHRKHAIRLLRDVSTSAARRSRRPRSRLFVRGSRRPAPVRRGQRLAVRQASGTVPRRPRPRAGGGRRVAPGAAGAEPTVGDERRHHRSPIAAVFGSSSFTALAPPSLARSPSRKCRCARGRRGTTSASASWKSIWLPIAASVISASISSRWLTPMSPAAGPDAWARRASVRMTSSKALEFICGRLPFVLLGLDSDNCGEFLNSHLVQYCSQHSLKVRRWQRPE